MTDLHAARNWTRNSIVAISLLALVSCSDSENPTNTATTASAQSNSAQVSADLGYRSINSANADDPLHAEIFELDNGLLVYLT